MTNRLAFLANKHQDLKQFEVICPAYQINEQVPIIDKNHDEFLHFIFRRHFTGLKHIIVTVYFEGGFFKSGTNLI